MDKDAVNHFKRIYTDYWYKLDQLHRIDERIYLIKQNMTGIHSPNANNDAGGHSPSTPDHDHKILMDIDKISLLDDRKARLQVDINEVDRLIRAMKPLYQIIIKGVYHDGKSYEYYAKMTNYSVKQLQRNTNAAIEKAMKDCGLI